MGTMIGAVLISFIRKGKQARGVLEEAMKVPGVAYVKIETGTDAAMERLRDEHVMRECEEALNEPETDTENGGEIRH
jgi:hypothetical protein